jgi:hypothetical protein
MSQPTSSYLNTISYHGSPPGFANNLYQQQQAQYAQPSLSGGFGFGAANQPVPYGLPPQQQTLSFGNVQPRMMQHNAAVVKKAQSNYRAATTYEKIKEYTDTTYSGINKGKSSDLIMPSLFWA